MCGVLVGRMEISFYDASVVGKRRRLLSSGVLIVVVINIEFLEDGAAVEAAVRDVLFLQNLAVMLQQLGIDGASANDIILDRSTIQSVIVPTPAPAPPCAPGIEIYEKFGGFSNESFFYSLFFF